MSILTLTKHLAALVLSMCFLLVTGGLAYTTPLDSHLGHHDQKTHGKTWCSWTCQAGQAIQPPSPHIPRAYSLLGVLVPFKPDAPDLVRTHHCAARAPPRFSFA
jgi:hypothetical protein